MAMKPVFFKIAGSILLTFALIACDRNPAPAENRLCDIAIVPLGLAQDAGKPQIGNPQDPAWDDAALRNHAVSLALIDSRTEISKRWLFEATPDIKYQINALNRLAPGEKPLDLSGVFLTHAHIGHYAGLMMFGHEAAGAQNISVYVMPRMAAFLTENGPWDQLVRFQNVLLAIMEAGEPEEIGRDLTVTPFLVPHRQEYSEVAGFKITGPGRSALFIPDIDSWEDWDREGVAIEDMIASVDYAFLDATFYANGEIPGRDMSGFPHPFVAHSMERFAKLPEEERAKIHFIHLNHTNPLLNPYARERQIVQRAGFQIAESGKEYCL